MDDRTATDFIKTQPLDRRAKQKRVKSRTGRRLGLLLLVAAAAAGWWLYGRQPAPAPRPARQNASTTTMPVVAAAAVTGNIDITVNRLGHESAHATVTIQQPSTLQSIV